MGWRERRPAALKFWTFFLSGGRKSCRGWWLAFWAALKCAQVERYLSAGDSGKPLRRRYNVSSKSRANGAAARRAAGLSQVALRLEVATRKRAAFDAPG